MNLTAAGWGVFPLFAGTIWFTLLDAEFSTRMIGSSGCPFSDDAEFQERVEAP